MKDLVVGARRAASGARSDGHGGTVTHHRSASICDMGSVCDVHRKQPLGRALQRVSQRSRPDAAHALSSAFDAPTILSLQGLAGNRAAQQAVRSLQRDPLDVSEDPHQYTAEAGVKDVRGSGMTRVEVHGLTMGLSSGFQTRYKSKRGSLASDEANKTAEDPQHMAVVVMPDQIPEGTPLQVILQFHGFGFRGGDPYAGYLVAKGDSNVAAGSVRDVDQEHWEQQLGAVNAGRTKGQPLAVAILAQGRGPDDFGDTATSAFVQQVLATRRTTRPTWSSCSTPKPSVRSPERRRRRSERSPRPSKAPMQPPHVRRSRPCPGSASISASTVVITIRTSSSGARFKPR
jgi:hypothetical protein